VANAYSGAALDMAEGNGEREVGIARSARTAPAGLEH